MLTTKEDELPVRLKELRRGWAKMEPETRTAAVSRVLDDVGTDPIRVWKAYEQCPPIRGESFFTAETVFLRALQTLMDFPQNKCEDPHTLMVASKMLAHSYTPDKYSSASLEVILLSILENADVALEVSLVAGTALANILLKSKELNFASHYSALLQAHRLKPFTTICLLEGVLNCGYNLVNGDLAFFHQVLDACLEACSVSSTHTFQSFQSLKILSSSLTGLSEKSEVLDRTSMRLIRVAEANWENPIKGVSDLLTFVYANVVDANKNPSDFLLNLLEANMAQLQWNIKSKYPPLEVLVPRIGADEVLRRYPDFGAGLVNSLSSNYLASAGSAVYKAFLKQVNLDAWDRHFRPHLEAALTSESDLIRCNARDQWLASTVVMVKGSGDMLRKNMKGSVAPMLVLKLDPKPWVESDVDEVERSLEHFDTEVRSAAFSAVCRAKKKGPAPSIDLIIQFVVNNLAVDSASFRQALKSDFTAILLRCRDDLVFKHRKSKLEKEDMALVKDLDRLLERLFGNCHPGANYQRLITCLDLLHLISDCFHGYEPGQVNKASSEKSDPGPLLDFCQTMNLFRLRTEKHFDVLVSCLLFHMADVREKAQQLLTHFSPDVKVIRALAKRAFMMLCSPKLCDCESGSGLLKLVQNWTEKSGLSLCDVMPFNHHSQILQGAAPKVDTVSNISEYLLATYENLVTKEETNFLDLARECPMHGLLTALRFCLKQDGHLLKPHFVARTVSILRESSHKMLARLGHTNASFADMSNAIESLLDDESSVEISEEHQLVLACAWLNLKECSLLSGHLVSVCKMSEEDTWTCGEILLTVATGCRHKGAMEATNLAVKEFSALLLGSKDAGQRNIPEELMLRVLDQLESPVVKSSVTRRSAGLPMFVQKIVSAEPKYGGRERRLLTLAISRLLSISSNPKDKIKETEDNPQCHALHVLRSLAHDSLLASDFSSHLSSVLMNCVDQFASPVWSVRNAALQLFGQIVPRTLGQKKVREEDSAENTLTVAEFFTRHADLAPYFLSKLNNYDDVNNNPALVPLLGLLSRISPGKIDTEEHMETVAKFKAAFFIHLGDKVAIVRRLAAKAFASFTSNIHLLDEFASVAARLMRKTLQTNAQNGLLLCLREILKQCNARGSTKDGMTKIAESLSYDCWSRSCSANKLLLLDVFEMTGVRPQLNGSENNVANEPGYRELKRRTKEVPTDVSEEEEESKDFKSTSDGMRMLVRLLDHPVKLVSFLAESLENPHLTGSMVKAFNAAVVGRHIASLSADPEAALDLLEVATCERIASGGLGISAATGAMISAAVAFSAMLLQPDYDMFFREESPYVALFVEFTERLESAADPGRNTEAARLDAGAALMALLPALNGREVGKLPLLSQYGFVNLLNTALTLSMDEDMEVRESVTQFANGLEPSTTLCTKLAMEKLVSYGLRTFPECLEWFRPMQEVFFLPWRDDPVEVIKTSTVRQCLFETGEGVNVYAEKIVSAITYEKIVREYLEVNRNFKMLTLDARKIIIAAETALDFCDGYSAENFLLPLSVHWTVPGYLLLTRLRNLLVLLRDFDVAKEPTPADEVKTLVARYESTLMHLAA